MSLSYSHEPDDALCANLAVILTCTMRNSLADKMLVYFLDQFLQVSVVLSPELLKEITLASFTNLVFRYRCCIMCFSLCLSCFRHYY